MAAAPGAESKLDTEASTHVLEADQWVPTALDDTFEFFADAANLEAITPPFLHFHILTPLPMEMCEGALIAYSMRLNGLPVRWLTRIEEYAPGVRFVDRQVRGPYRRWIHTHTFEAERDGTRVRDRIEYELPWEPLSTPLHRLYVRPTLDRIFEHRRHVIARLLGDQKVRQGRSG